MLAREWSLASIMEQDVKNRGRIWRTIIERQTRPLPQRRPKDSCFYHDPVAPPSLGSRLGRVGRTPYPGFGMTRRVPPAICSSCSAVSCSTSVGCVYSFVFMGLSFLLYVLCPVAYKYAPLSRVSHTFRFFFDKHHLVTCPFLTCWAWGHSRFHRVSTLQCDGSLLY